MKRNFLGMVKINNIEWVNVASINIDIGLIGADLHITVSNPDHPMTGKDIDIYGLQKGDAKKLYKYALSQERAWRESRRERFLEQLRARSGGTVLVGSPAMPNATPITN